MQLGRLLVKQVQEVKHDVVLLDLPDHVCDLALEEGLRHHELVVYVLDQLPLALDLAQYAGKVLDEAVDVSEVTVFSDLELVKACQLSENEQVVYVFYFLCH